MLIFDKIMSNLCSMKITFLSLIIFIFLPILSLSAKNVELTKNHKKAIAWDCKYNLNDEFDSINDCKNLLVIALKRDGVLFNLNNFKKKKIDKAEKSCSKRIKKGVYQYNACLAEYFNINIEIEEPPIVVASVDENEEENTNNQDIGDEENYTQNSINENDIEEDDQNEIIQERETNNEIILTANDIYNKVVKSSFQVWATDNVNSENWVCGSSVVIKKNKLATNCHVVLKDNFAPHKNIFLINHKDDAKKDISWKDAKVIAKDPGNDICIVESSSVFAPPVNIKKFEKIEMLEEAYVVGGPECKPGVMTSGQIQNKYDFGYTLMIQDELVEFTVPLLQTNAHIRGGNSGGGLFDKNGNLIGITTIGELSDSPNPFNLAISADNFIKLLEK